MSGALNTGAGRCHAKTRLLIKPRQSVIEAGACPDVQDRVLKTVHRLNRCGSSQDFIAIALPTMQMGRDCMMPGPDIELFGSEDALTLFLQQEDVKRLLARAMVQDPVIQDAYFDAGTRGVAYVRDRSCEKHTAAWVRRTAARAERRGKALGAAVKLRKSDVTALTLTYGEKKLHIRELHGDIAARDVMVSTFGFSSPSSPAVLPVMSLSKDPLDAI